MTQVNTGTDNYVRPSTPAQLRTALNVADGANNYSFPYTIDTGASANTVVRRQANGYIFGVYYNGTGTFATSGNASGMGMFTGTNGSDTYGRSYTAAAARTLLNIENGATADQTAAQILTAIKTVDVNGTAGVNAGTLDGKQPSASGGANKILATHATNGYLYLNNWIHPANSTGLFYDAGVHFYEVGNKMYSSTSFTSAVQGTLWGSSNDGSNSGLDADLLDAQHGSYYLAYGNFSGTPTIPSGNQIIDWTADQGATNIHAGNYLNTNTTNLGIQAETGAIEQYQCRRNN